MQSFGGFSTSRSESLNNAASRPEHLNFSIGDGINRLNYRSRARAWMGCLSPANLVYLLLCLYQCEPVFSVGFAEELYCGLENCYDG